tara:strand:+ start:292 stop:1254 length:963 start_codon:yes stop_codon:yes gene_type:complete
LKKNYIILTELGNKNSGSGHLMRSLILKEKLSKNCKIFITKKKNKLLKLKKKVLILNKETELKNYVKKNCKNILVIDKYRNNLKSIKILNNYFDFILVYNDLNFYKDNKYNFIIIKPQNIKKFKFGKKVLEGHNIFPVNQKLIDVRKKYKINKEIKKILIFFGGDIKKQTLIKILFTISKVVSKKIKFFLYTNQNMNEIDLPDNIIIKKINRSYFNDLPKYDLGIISSGFIKFDLFTIGMPILYFPVYSHQKVLAKYFTNKKFGLSFDKLKFYKKPKLLNKSYNIEEFFSYKKRLKYYKHFRANFDGKGSERIINFINKL